MSAFYGSESLQDCVALNLLFLFILCGLCFTGPLCGQLSTTNRNISVSTNEVTVRFISGTHRSGRGFVMSYSTNQHSGNGSCPATQHFPPHPTSPINSKQKRNPYLSTLCDYMVLFALSLLYMIRVNTPGTVCTAYSVNSISSDSGSGSSSHPNLNYCLHSFPTSYVNCFPGGCAQIAK